MQTGSDKTGHADVKYRVGNMVTDIAVTMYGARRVLEILRGTLCEVHDYLTSMLYT